MNLLVVGGGGREHTIIKKLKQNPAVETIYALPGNGGIAADATCVDIKATDIEGIVAFTRNTKIDYAVVAPDDPLVLGCVDALEAEGIPCFGPRANAAIIEGSKVFSKDLMKKYGIPTAAYEVFSDPKKALEYLETSPIPTVITHVAMDLHHFCPGDDLIPGYDLTMEAHFVNLGVDRNFPPVLFRIEQSHTPDLGHAFN